MEENSISQNGNNPEITLQQQDQPQQQIQNFTYYYSSFDLFDQAQEFTFIKYRKFIKKLYRYLGGDWQVYANTAVFTMVEDVKQYLLYDELFEIGLQSWLEIRDSFTRQRKSSYDEEQITNEEDEIQYFEENHIYEQFLQKFQQNLANYQVDPVIFKPVAQGFFMSAVEIWNETIKSIKNQRVLSHNSLYELGMQKEKELQEQQEQQSQQKKSFKRHSHQDKSIVGKLYNNVQQYAQSNVIVKPLIVASEKIFGSLGLGSKKVKENNQKKIHSPNQLSQKSQENLSKFQNQLISEEQMVMSKIKQLSLQEKTLNRKRKQYELEDESEEESQNVQVEDFPKKAEKLNEQVYNVALDYIQTLKKNTVEKWSVARGFVTNFIDFNSNLLDKTQKISSEYSSQINIRFLQPAQQFYNQLMQIWILFRQSTQGSQDFKKYLEKVKQSMGNKWNETYILPTQLFFKTLVFTWDEMTNEQKEAEDDEVFLKSFLERVRGNMLKNWESNIVNRIQSIKLKNTKSQQLSKQTSQQHSMQDIEENTTVDQENNSTSQLQQVPEQQEPIQQQYPSEQEQSQSQQQQEMEGENIQQEYPVQEQQDKSSCEENQQIEIENQQ